MFIKPTKSKNFTYAQLVESYRDEEGKNRHRVIFNLGRVEAQSFFAQNWTKAGRALLVERRFVLLKIYARRRGPWLTYHIQ